MSPTASRSQTPDQYSRSRPDATIAVMGATGTGKSTFVRLVTGDERIKIGHSLRSETFDVNTATFFEADGRAVTLIDTPGFDDSRDGVTDTDILKKISSFLQVEHEEGRKLNGLIYMHRINDVRVGGVSRRNLRMFQKLCGSKSLRNVVIVTTMWDTVSEELGAQRERELMTDTFKALLDEGAEMKRFNNGITSAREIISYILFHDPVILQIQQELAEGKELVKTAAGEELNAEMARLIEKHKQDMIALREEFEAMIKSRDEQAQKEIVAERQKMQAEIQKWQNAVIELKKGLDSVKAQAEQDRRTTEAEKEKRRAEFLAQIAVERQRWEKTARETAEKKQFNEKTLQEQFGAKIKDANTRTERLQNQLERDRELLRKMQTASLAEPQKPREVQVRASLSYATDWAKVETTTYGTAFTKDPLVGSEVYRNVTITPTSLMISRPFSEAFRSGRVPFIIVNQGNPIDITTTHGRDRYRLGDRGGCATVEFSNNQYVNSKGQDRDNRMVFSNCVMRA